MISSDKLERQIENLIQEHIAACQAAVAATVDRAFAAARSKPTSGPRQAKPPAVQAMRRTPEEMTALGEQFYTAVCANPGETMTFLAAQLGTTSRLLARPVAQLKRAGRVRSVGERSHTRYFPLVGEGDKAVNA